jgi:hypothetical protein
LLCFQFPEKSGTGPSAIKFKDCVSRNAVSRPRLICGLQSSRFQLQSSKTDATSLRRVGRAGNADIFEPIVARDVTRNRVLDQILSFFGGTAAPMMAQLADAGKLTPEDIQEVEETLRRLKARRREKSK